MACQHQPGFTEDSHDSQTASEFINNQLQLEADAREVLPYAFDSCSQPLGALRQTVFACTTCNPPPASPAQVYTPAGICYSCSIACHGDHTLVELFSRRNFVCDCGSTRMPSTSPCTLRSDPATGTKGVHSEEAAKGNHYNHNFQNKFCGCDEEYDADQEKGTMYQCLGLGTVETGGCGEDWWHPECLLGLPRDWHIEAKFAAEQEKDGSDGHLAPVSADSNEEHPVPPEFPQEEDFEALLCYKCVESNPWIKQYANAPGFHPTLLKRNPPAIPACKPEPPAVEADGTNEKGEPALSGPKKRKASDDMVWRFLSPSKRVKEDAEEQVQENGLQTAKNGEQEPKQKHDLLLPAPHGIFSLFMRGGFRDNICHCPKCYPNLIPHPQLVEEEDTYEPPVSESGNSDAGPGSGARSQGTGSLLERGEAALSTVDRVRAIEGVMVYNHLKEKVKEFLKPYAEGGKAVPAEDIKAYFETLRGDEAAIREAGTKPGTGEDDKENNGGTDNRREQSGY